MWVRACAHVASTRKTFKGDETLASIGNTRENDAKQGSGHKRDQDSVSGALQMQQFRSGEAFILVNN